MTETIIAEHYLLGEKLGAGGMGIVYLGQDTRTEKSVAIKQLKPGLVQDDILERFKREGEALRDLNHPNIVKMLDALEDDGKHYLIMEYISGGDLSDLLKKDQLSLEQILTLSIDLADALTRAHKLNIIHRDLKPANVLIGDDGVLCLTDFGVAHVGSKERVTDTDAIVGTIDYLPPEAFDSRGFDARGDIWAFGIMLFEMLTGDCPFKGGTVLQMVQSIVSDPIPDLESLRPDISTDLIDLIYRMLERDPLARIPSVRIIGAELEAIQEGRSTQTPPATRFSIVDSDFIFAIKKHNLPAQVTEFVGREHELAELAKLLQDKSLRLMTIIAPGGMGKTRLSLEAAERSLDYFSNGIYFVELAPLSNPEQIISAIANALDVTFQQDGREQKQQILDYLQHKQILLLMDNFEHLLDGADLVTEILNTAPGVQVLVTSRQRLGQRGETIFHLSGMDFPDWETPGEALQYAAVKLFVNSAKHALPSFELTGDNLNAVARICRLVQGMPLGIVLSGAWVAMLSPQEIASELEQNMDILSDESGELPERQQSIRAVMDYSWLMMSEAEQSVFMKLSIFKGGFTREASEAVAGANLRILMSLVTKSLLRRDADSGRYEIHELLRRYAGAKLDEAGESDTTYESHKNYYLNLLAEREVNIKGHGQLKVLKLLDADLENISRAWIHAVNRRDYNTLGKSWLPLELLLVWNDHFTEINKLKQFAVNALDESHPVKIRIQISVEQDIDIVERYIKLAQERNSLADVAAFQQRAGVFLYRDARYHEAITVLLESLNYYQKHGNQFDLADAYSEVGYCYSLQGEAILAQKYVQQAMQINRENGNIISQINNLNRIAITLSVTESYSKAEKVWEEVYTLYAQTHNRGGIALMTVVLSLTAFLQGKIEKAKMLADEGLEKGQNISSNNVIALGWYLKSLITSTEGNYQQGIEYANQGQEFPALDVHIKNDADWCLSLAYLGLKDTDSAENHNVIALQFALNSQSPTLMLCYLPITAVILAQNGQSRRAIEVYSLVLNHPQATNGWLEKWELLNDMIEQLKLDANKEYETHFKHGQSLDLVTTVRELIAEFEDD